MVPADYHNCQTYFSRWAKEYGCTSALICSPNYLQEDLVSRLCTGPIKVLQQEDWNLEKPCPFPNSQVVVACNVFHYSAQPVLWFQNVLASCQYFWLQDLFSRPRGGNGELGADGDKLRFAYGGVRTASIAYRYDLAELGDRLLDFHLYDAGSFAERRAMINFVALIRGDLT